LKDLSTKDRLNLLWDVFKYRPKFTIIVILLSIIAALFEGVGLGFIYPIIETTQSSDGFSESSIIISLFASLYNFLNLPLNLESLILGVSTIMVLRYSTSFLVGWLKAMLSKKFEGNLKKRSFNHALNSKISYFDKEGTDNVINHIITETGYSGKVITRVISIIEKVSMILIYLSVMTYISPPLTLISLIILGSIVLLMNLIVEPAISIGSRVAEANESMQRSVQAGLQGIRDVKLFGVNKKIFENFEDSLNKYMRGEINLARNDNAMKKLYKMSASLTLFLLIYIGFSFTKLNLGELGIFFVAMFQLAPRISELNSKVYKIDSYLSHLSRTKDFLGEISNEKEITKGESISEIEDINFDDVTFSYTYEECVLEEVNIQINKGDYVAFVGQSGAGKSTLASLIPRMYNPDSGCLKSGGQNIQDYDLDSWRDRISIVRQQAFIFNESLKENIKVGKPEATDSEVEEICELAQVNEFVDELPNGYESELGDNGIKLSGGQRQRVALARALIKDSDFLILDEATSELDSKLEKKVLSAIENQEKDYGIIAIAHRLSSIKNADMINVLENGKILEKGSHQELLEKEGKYSDLYDAQNKKV